MKVIYTLATAGFSDLVDLKVGTSLAKAGNVREAFQTIKPKPNLNWQLAVQIFRFI